MANITHTLSNLIHSTAFFHLTWGNYVMILVALVFLYLAIRHGFEPLLLVPIAFGMLLVNIYPDIMADPASTSNGVGGLLHYFYTLDEWSILPSLIFLGVGAMTDFGPLIANPKRQYVMTPKFVGSWIYLYTMNWKLTMVTGITAYKLEVII